MRVFIFGGTRGLGLALAKHYLLSGHSVTIAGRNLERMAEITAEKLPNLHYFALDVADSAAVQAALREYASQGLDLVIVTAGLYFNDRQHALDAASTRAMLETNVNGLSHVLQHASNIMLAQGSGQIAAVASVAGLLSDYPGASVYSATKRCVLQLCDSYQRALSGFGISVTAIIPGYIDTERLRELNSGSASHKPFLVTEAFAVKQIVTAIAKRELRCAFPWQLHMLVWLIGGLPRRLQRLILLRKR